MNSIKSVLKSYPNLIDVIESAAIQAGKDILAEYERGATSVITKSDNSPLTTADNKAHQRIVTILKAHFQDITIISEEGNYELSNGANGVFFLVDPLDGTKEFINQTGEFTVNIALVCDGRAELGVVYVPMRDALYSTTKHGTARLVNNVSETKSKVESSELSVRSLPAKGATIVMSASHSSVETSQYCMQYKPALTISSGSSLKFCLVAEGNADYYPRLGRTMEWDTAAAHAILKAAGGNVYCLSNGSEITYGKPGLDNDYFIATAASNEIIKSKLNWR